MDSSPPSEYKYVIHNLTQFVKSCFLELFTSNFYFSKFGNRFIFEFFEILVMTEKKVSTAIDHKFKNNFN